MSIKAIGFDYVGVISKYPGADQQIIGLADRLRLKYKVGVLSNLSSGWQRELEQLGIDEHFDAVILGGDQDLVKPSQSSFQALAKALQVKTNELVFIDDSRSNLAGVEVIGVRPVLFTGYEALLTELTRLGVRL